MNKVFLIGNLTAAPTLKTTPQGVSVGSFTVAVDRRKSTDRSCDYFQVTAWRQLAENCAKYLDKGNKVAVSGFLQNHNFEDANGVKHYTNDIVATSVEFLTKPRVLSQDEELPE